MQTRLNEKLYFSSMLKLEKMLKVDLIDNSKSDEALEKKFEWQVISYIDQEMDIQIMFDQPLLISSSNYDKIRVTFVNTDLIFGKKGQEVENGTQV